jgi:hypothetical protein
VTSASSSCSSTSLSSSTSAPLTSSSTSSSPSSSKRSLIPFHLRPINSYRASRLRSHSRHVPLTAGTGTGDAAQQDRAGRSVLIPPLPRILKETKQQSFFLDSIPCHAHSNTPTMTDFLLLFFDLRSAFFLTGRKVLVGYDFSAPGDGPSLGGNSK